MDRVFRVQTQRSEKRALDQLFGICKQCPLSRHGLQRSEKPAARAKRCCASEEEKSKVCFVPHSRHSSPTIRGGSECRLRADCVEKLQHAKLVFFRRNSGICESQIGLWPRGDEGAQQCHMTDLADPLTKIDQTACAANEFTDLPQKPEFFNTISPKEPMLQGIRTAALQLDPSPID